MTKFHLPSFSSPANTKDYRDNFEKVFGKKKKAPEKSPEPVVETEEIEAEDTPKEE